MATLNPSLFVNNPTQGWGADSWGSDPWGQTSYSYFYSPTVTTANTVAPALLTNSNTFYAATVLPGPVTVSPTLYTNTNTFYAAAITTANTLSAARYDNTNVFYAATVTPGAVTLSPSLFTNTNTFYAVTASSVYALTAARYDNTNTFYAVTATSTYQLDPPLYTNTQTFYGPTVDYVAYRYSRPDSDFSTGSWAPSSGVDLYPMVDEETPSDADYITTDVASTCEMGLQPVIDPGTSTGHTVSYRIRSTKGSAIVVTLKQGATTIASKTELAVPSTWTTYSFTLSAAQTDAITDYSDLRVTLEAA